MNAKCLCAAVELNVPDILKEGPKSLTDLATASNSRPDRLRQVLRVLHNDGIFAYDSFCDTYSNNTVSELLLSDHWTQWRNWVDLYGNEFFEMAQGIPKSCRKDAVRSPAQIHFNTDKTMFSYFTERGWQTRLHNTLGGGAIAQAQGILEDYPWGEVSNSAILDVGGGAGGLVATLLRKHKNMTAGVLDLADVIEHARANFHGHEGQYRDVGNQVPSGNLIVGDFMKEIPRFKVYTMKWCLHDWDDSKALVVLANIRRAIIPGPESRLVVLESILEEGRMGRLSRYADLNMMVAVGGQERTEDQWRSLAHRTGWEIKRIFKLRNAWPCAIEFVPASSETIHEVLAVPRTDTNPITNGKLDIHDPLEAPHEDSATSSTDMNVTTNGKVNVHDPSTTLKVKTQMRFLEPWDPSRGNPFIRSAPAEGFQYMNFNWVDCPVSIVDARNNKGDFDLDIHGFSFYDDPRGAAPELLEALRQNSPDVVKNLYYPHIERLVKKATGASRVIIFDHTQRKRRPELGAYENSTGKEQPATMVSTHKRLSCIHS